MFKKTFIAAAMAIAATAVALPARAQYTYDWSRGEAGGDPVRTGRPVTLTVTGLNPLCYDTQLKASPVDDAPNLTNFVKFEVPASPQPAPQKTEVPPPAPPVTPAAPAPGMKQLWVLGQLWQDSVFVERGGVTVALEQAEVALTRASELLSEVEQTRLRAAFFTTVIASPPCHRGWDAAGFFEQWDREKEPVRALLTGSASRMDAARIAISTSDTRVRQAEAILAGLPTPNDYQALVEDKRSRTAAMQEAYAKINTELPPVRESFLANWNTLETRRGAARLSTVVAPGHDASHIRLDIVSHPRAQPGGKTPEPVTETQSVPLRRQFRSFLSTGLLVTFMRVHDYARVNRPYLVKDTTGAVTGYADSTYSTFATQQTGLFDVFSPAVQFNVSFWDPLDTFSGGDIYGTPLMASFGAAARSVNGRILPEPFAGLSLSVADRLVLTFGGHFGRDETLLIQQPSEKPEDVAQRKVPAAVTDKDAIGTDWDARLFLTFSVRT